MRHSKPKMLIFSHICTPQYITGAEKLLLFMVRELLPTFDCTLVVPNDGVIAEHARRLDIPVIIQDVPLINSLYSAESHMNDEIAEKQQSVQWRELIHLLNSERPDIVLTNTCVHPLPAIAGKSLGIPVVWTVMEAIRRTPYTSAAAAVIERYSDYLLGISEAALAPLRTPGLLPKTSLILPSWHHGELAPETWREQRQNRRNQLGITDGHKLIGYISSSIYEAKGLEHFMQMAVDVSERFPQAVFLIVGNPIDPAYFEKCLDYARSRNIIGRFRWIRFEEQVQTVYPAMDILVVPSLSVEGFGMTALEGMVFGKPVIVYGSGGLAEIGESTGNGGFVVPTGHVEGLFNRVSRLLGDEALLQAVGARNLEAAIGAFGIDAYRDRLRKFVDALIVRGYIPLWLVRGSGPTVYLFEDGVLRPFGSEEAFLGGGYLFEDVRTVPDSMIASLPQGEPIGGHTPQRGGKRRRRTAGRRRGGPARRRQALPRKAGSRRSRRSGKGSRRGSASGGPRKRR
ncbi:glycosyltransferase family 4 protein [Paenibacillus sp. sptzw28]|uniref:glycosyltransferase family 4 protein n=1 Tax=Paenibacillus sp. sptzw28 TaxID=715179 RepID=UPI001C6E4BF9|nr:glycosyltransferase family 4 protein [Paenibacillus sp. sptzw28]QYR23031.1 glycosyltransferase family 4 protein [Paenibacillus sp. sptzw28]